MPKAMNTIISFDNTIDKIAKDGIFQRAMRIANSHQKIIDEVFRESAMEKMLRSSSASQKAIDAIQKSIHKTNLHQKSIGETLSERATLDAIKALNSERAYRENFEKLLGGRAGIEAIKAFHSISSHRGSFEGILGKVSFQNAVDRLTQQTDLFTTFDLLARANEQIHADELPDVVFDNEKVDIQLQEIGEANDSGSIEKAFAKLPWLIRIFLIYIIFQTIQAITSNVIANLITPRVEQIIGYQTKPDKVKIEQLKALSVGELDTSNLRFVTSAHLLLREKPSTESEIRNELRFGQVVTVISKQRNWIEISYTDENGEILNGWICTRYTSKFKM